MTAAATAGRGSGDARGYRALDPRHWGHRQLGSPADRVPIVYVAASPARQAEARIREVLADFTSRELTEIRWVNLAEAEVLMTQRGRL